LDWSLPAYPHQPQHSAPGPVRVEVDLTDFRRLVQANEHYRQAVQQSQAGQWARVIESCSRAIELDSTSAMAFRLRAWAYAAQSRWQKADADLAVVDRLAPGPPGGRYQP